MAMRLAPMPCAGRKVLRQLPTRRDEMTPIEFDDMAPSLIFITTVAHRPAPAPRAKAGQIGALRAQFPSCQHPPHPPPVPRTHAASAIWIGAQRCSSVRPEQFRIVVEPSDLASNHNLRGETPWRATF